MDLAFEAYDLEAEGTSAELYQVLKTSSFSRVRAEYYFCYGVFRTGGDDKWRDRMKILGRQEWLLLAKKDPFFQRCSDRKDRILAMQKASREIVEAEKKKEGGDDDVMDTGL